MNIGTVVNFRHFKNCSKKSTNIGIILEVQKDLLILKEYSGLGYTREDLMRIYWFLEGSRRAVPHYKIDGKNRPWYLKNNVYTIS